MNKGEGGATDDGRSLPRHSTGREPASIQITLHRDRLWLEGEGELAHPRAMCCDSTPICREESNPKSTYRSQKKKVGDKSVPSGNESERTECEGMEGVIICFIAKGSGNDSCRQ
ncbi:hypothetical protein CEXT_259501 [Caerostris extrusa]|uniref:Uncharacterized protein n=1 Tax=Caerostris extrusa TaxID=172846 RepID=A0AAV4WDZ1_CAEEX|nr:hypothetical protein CEXT_259501 [Caerostris extrusa]